jgi:hypothetical protein
MANATTRNASPKRATAASGPSSATQIEYIGDTDECATASSATIMKTV